MNVRLVMFTQNGERRDFEIHEGKTTIGRNGECGIQIKLGVVSRRHCQVIVRKDKVKVRDLGSSNGTFVNNRRIQEVTIGAGETLTVGPVIFTVVIDDMPAEIKTVRTIVEPKRAKKAAGAGGEKSQESGELAAEESGGFELVIEHDEEEEEEEEEAVDGHNPLAELAEISKQHGKVR